MRGWLRTLRFTVIAAVLIGSVISLFTVAVFAGGTFNVGAGDAAGLVTAMSSATGGGTSTINLATNSTYTLTAVNNTGINGGNGLPVITTGNDITINGNGATIQRDTSVLAFRLFVVSSNATLRLNNVTLRNGVGSGATGAAGSNGTACPSSGEDGGDGGNGTPAGNGAGGAILNSGTLVIAGSGFFGNYAIGGNGGAGGDAADGCLNEAWS